MTQYCPTGESQSTVRCIEQLFPPRAVILAIWNGHLVERFNGESKDVLVHQLVDANDFIKYTHLIF